MSEKETPLTWMDGARAVRDELAKYWSGSKSTSVGKCISRVEAVIKRGPPGSTPDEARHLTHPGGAVDETAEDTGWKNGVNEAWMITRGCVSVEEARYRIEALGNIGRHDRARVLEMIKRGKTLFGGAPDE